MDAEKRERLQKLGATARIGGKGTPRRKVKKVSKPTVSSNHSSGTGAHHHHHGSSADDKKLGTALKKLNVQPTFDIHEVNMFKRNGTVIHFEDPKVQASISANIFVINGKGEDKELTQLLPGIIRQLGPESLESLRRLAETFQTQGGGAGSLKSRMGGMTGKPDEAGISIVQQGDNDDDEDEDVPDLIENFDEVATGEKEKGKEKA